MAGRNIGGSGCVCRIVLAAAGAVSVAALMYRCEDKSAQWARRAAIAARPTPYRVESWEASERIPLRHVFRLADSDLSIWFWRKRLE